MKLFVIGSAIPCGEQDMPSVTAVNVVQHELLLSLMRLGHEVTFQLLFNPHRTSGELTTHEQTGLRALSARNVAVAPPIFPHEYAQPPFGWLRQMGLRAWRLAGGTRFDSLYPSVRIAPQVIRRVTAGGSNAVLTLWSPEGLAATHGLDDVPRIAYHGDIDFQTEQARQLDRDLFSATGRPANPAAAAVERVRARFAASESNRAHWELMRRVTVIANVTASNAEHYRALGHQRSVYVRNTWPDPRLQGGVPNPAAVNGSPIKIIGHIGYLDRTGSTYGLRLLLEEVVPALRRIMGDLDYRVEIIGGGAIVPALRPLLNQERVIVRGFVPDLAGELDASDVVLMCNNSGRYQAAFTRHLVAWSHGLCLIVHEKSRLAIPEIVPGKNVLAGSTGAQIAEQIRLAVMDRALNRRIRAGGRATYEQHFTPIQVASALSREMQAPR